MINIEKIEANPKQGFILLSIFKNNKPVVLLCDRIYASIIYDKLYYIDRNTVETSSVTSVYIKFI